MAVKKKKKLKRKIKIIVLLCLSILLIGSASAAYYITQVYEDITQKVKEVTLEYNEKAPTNSAYYFEGQRSDVEFDQALFKFDEIKDYTVTLHFRDKDYPVIFHVEDHVKPKITLPVKEVDLYKGFSIDDLYTAKDEKSKVKVTLNMSEEDFTVGEHEFCVSAKDQSGNTEKKCQIINVVDSTPKVDVVSKVSFDYDYKNMSLEAILKDYMKKRGLTTQVAISYHNFGTGEEYFVNGNQWMVAGSTYKLPLNMYYYEQENAGKISQSDSLLYEKADFEEGGPIGDTKKPGDKISIADLQFYSIVYSDNTASRILYKGIGGWGSYREAIKKYSSINYETPYYSNNITVHYMNDVLVYLYQHLNSFPELSQRLYGVAPGDCLKRYLDVPIMQKDGCYGSAWNAAGLVMSDHPYAVSVYTSLGEAGKNVMGEINVLLYNYAQAH